MKFRLTKEEIQKRVLELETLLGQKGLAEKLKVSKDSIRRYRDGKTSPQSQTIYKNLNKLYNKNKNFIDTGLVEKKRQQIQKRKASAKTGAKKFRTGLIYPEYMYESPASDFSESTKFDKLEDLHNQGYVVAWQGGKEMPLEAQFIIHGEDLTRFGKIVNIVGIVSTEVSPKADNGFTGQSTSLKVYPTYFRLIPGIKKTLKFNERMDILREYFFDLKVDRGFTIAFLGFYFNEGDET